MSNKKRPNCQVSGCNNGAQNAGRRKDGSIIYRKSKGLYICGTHHQKAIAKKYGFDSYAKAFPNKRLQEAIAAGYPDRFEYNKAMYLKKAKEAGFDNKEEYQKWVRNGSTDWYIAGYSNGIEYQEALYQAKMKEAGFDDKKEYQAHLINVRNYGSYEAITKMKCQSYFHMDRKRNLWNSYNSVEEMTDDLIDLVHENMKRNNGKVISEMEGIELSYKLKDIFQISFDRIDNTIGHAGINIRIVSEPFNTMTKDKFNDEDWYNYREALVEAA